MKRTTLALEDEVLRKLKERALKDGTSLARLANRLLASALKESPPEAETAVDWPVHDCGPPAVDLADRDALYDLMDGR